MWTPQRIATLSKGGGFDLRGYLSSLSDGFLFDYTAPDWLRQEPNGPTAVAANNDVIGLGLSRRLVGQQGTLAAYLAGQPNLAPAFVPAGTGWTVTGTDATHIVTFGDGTARYQSDTTSPVLFMRLNNVFVLGRTYAVTVETLARTGGSLKISAQSGLEPVVANALGAVTVFVTASESNLSLLRNSANVDVTIGSITIKEVSRAAATQTGSARPRWQGAAGASFDLIDDNHLTGFLAGAGANFLAARVTVQAGLTAVQSIGTAFTAWNNKGFGLLIGANGQLRFRAGDISLQAGGDLRGQNIVAAVSNDGTTIRAFVNDQQIYEAAQTGLADATVPLRIGAVNNDGTAATLFGGQIQKVVAGRSADAAAFLDLSRFRQIASQL